MRTDFENLTDGASIILHPRPENPLHKRDIRSTYSGGYFFCEGTDPVEGPDYYMGDVFAYCYGYTVDPTTFA